MGGSQIKLVLKPGGYQLLGPGGIVPCSDCYRSNPFISKINV